MCIITYNCGVLYINYNFKDNNGYWWRLLFFHLRSTLGRSSMTGSITTARREGRSRFFTPTFTHNCRCTLDVRGKINIVFNYCRTTDRDVLNRHYNRYVIKQQNVVVSGHILTFFLYTTINGTYKILLIIINVIPRLW